MNLFGERTRGLSLSELYFQRKGWISLELYPNFIKPENQYFCPILPFWCKLALFTISSALSLQMICFDNTGFVLTSRSVRNTKHWIASTWSYKSVESRLCSARHECHPNCKHALNLKKKKKWWRKIRQS